MIGFLAVGKARRAIFPPSPGFKAGTFDSSGFFTEGYLNFCACITLATLRPKGSWQKYQKTTQMSTFSPFCLQSFWKGPTHPPKKKLDQSMTSIEQTLFAFMLWKACFSSCFFFFFWKTRSKYDKLFQKDTLCIVGKVGQRYQGPRKLPVYATYRPRRQHQITWWSSRQTTVLTFLLLLAMSRLPPVWDFLRLGSFSTCQGQSYCQQLVQCEWRTLETEIAEFLV